MGMFIAVEGIDGSGKSTLAQALADRLGGTLTAFPNRGTYLGKIIDRWLQGAWHVEPSFHPDHGTEGYDLDNLALTEAAVFQALQTCNRLEVLRELEAARRLPGPLVCDRWWPSGYAYGSADGLPTSLLLDLHRLYPQPDLYILVDCPLELAAERIRSRSGAKAEKYEKRGFAYAKKVQAAYYQLWEQHILDETPRWVCVENRGSLDATVHQALLAVQQVRRG